MEIVISGNSLLLRNKYHSLLLGEFMDDGFCPSTRMENIKKFRECCRVRDMHIDVCQELD